MLCDTDRESHRCCPKAAELGSECKLGPGSLPSVYQNPRARKQGCKGVKGDLVTCCSVPFH